MLCVVCCSVESVPRVSAWSGLHFCLAAPIPPATSTSFCVHIPVIQTLNLDTPLPSHLLHLYCLRDLVLLFSYCRFLYISQYQDIFYLGRQSINLTQITFTEKFSCALAPSSISLVRFILHCGNININSIEVVPAAVPRPAPACRQLWGSAAALQTTLVATLTAQLKSWGQNIGCFGQFQKGCFKGVEGEVGWVKLVTLWPTCRLWDAVKKRITSLAWKVVKYILAR